MAKSVVCCELRDLAVVTKSVVCCELRDLAVVAKSVVLQQGLTTHSTRQT